MSNQTAPIWADTGSLTNHQKKDDACVQNIHSFVYFFNSNKWQRTVTDGAKIAW